MKPRTMLKEKPECVPEFRISHQYVFHNSFYGIYLQSQLLYIFHYRDHLFLSLQGNNDQKNIYQSYNMYLYLYTQLLLLLKLYL